MFEFFIALFGSLFYGGKLSKESSQKRRIERFDYQRDRIDELLRPSKKDISEIQYELGDPKRRWGLVETIMEELMEVYGMSWKKELMNSADGYGTWSIYEQPWGIVYNLLLAKRGKVTNSSYSLRDIKDYQRQRVIKTCQMIERNIQNKYPELKILFVPNPVNNELCIGELRWSHWIYDNSSARSLW